jgi:hypothetical protein
MHVKYFIVLSAWKADNNKSKNTFFLNQYYHASEIASPVSPIFSNFVAQIS